MKIALELEAIRMGLIVQGRYTVREDSLAWEL